MYWHFVSFKEYSECKQKTLVHSSWYWEQTRHTYRFTSVSVSKSDLVLSFQITTNYPSCNCFSRLQRGATNFEIGSHINKNHCSPSHTDRQTDTQTAVQLALCTQLYMKPHRSVEFYGLLLKHESIQPAVPTQFSVSPFLLTDQYVWFWNCPFRMKFLALTLWHTNFFGELGGKNRFTT
jgi:hypothetical protein